MHGENHTELYNFAPSFTLLLQLMDTNHKKNVQEGFINNALPIGIIHQNNFISGTFTNTIILNLKCFCTNVNGIIENYYINYLKIF